MISTWELENEPATWRFCRDVALRALAGAESSWGLGAGAVDDLETWASHLRASECRFGGAVTLGGVPRFGLCAARRREWCWESGLFLVEKEASGSGLAAELYEITVCEATRLDERDGLGAVPWRAWVPEEDTAFERFLSRRGWGAIDEPGARRGRWWELPVR